MEFKRANKVPSASDFANHYKKKFYYVRKLIYDNIEDNFLRQLK